jgi:hypothetical protein
MTEDAAPHQVFLRSRTGRVALLVALILDVFAVPLLMALEIVPPRFGDVVFAVVMLVAIYAMGLGRSRSWALGLATLAFLAQFLRFFGTGKVGAIVDASLSATALGVFAILVLVDTLRSDPVVDRLIDVVLVYVLLGATYALVYEIVDRAAPGALNLPSTRRQEFEYVYFSFTTMTSLGYGDVVPVSPVARLVAVLQALTGQLYVAVLIARFVNAGQARRARTAAPP